MMLLASMRHFQLEGFAHPHLGRLVTPKLCDAVDDTAAAKLVWAADNDAFAGFREGAFVRMLDRLVGLPGCKFVACPDVVGDHHATRALLADWHDPIHLERRLPLGFVLQDGVTAGTVPWPYLDAVFVGGTDRFKGSPVVAEIVAEAKRRGKWAHMGRVNTIRRMRYAASIGCDSVDGTKYSRWSKTHLPHALACIANGGHQLAL